MAQRPHRGILGAIAGMVQVARSSETPPLVIPVDFVAPLFSQDQQWHERAIGWAPAGLPRFRRGFNIRSRLPMLLAIAIEADSELNSG